ASVRVCMKFRIYRNIYNNIYAKFDYIIEHIESYSTYLIIVRGGGQQPVLKRDMRSSVVDILEYLIKILFEASDYIWNKLNYWTQSCFGKDSSFSWELHLHEYICCLVIKICAGVSSILITNTLLIALRTDNKMRSIYNIVINQLLHVIHATGEVSKKELTLFNFNFNFYKKRWQRSRSSMSKYTQMKGTKYLIMNNNINQIRSYSTRNKKDNSVIVQLQEENAKELDFLVKHWQNCINNPTRIFKDLKGYLKLDGIWLASYIKIMNNRGSTVGLDKLAVDSLTRLRIYELKEAVLSNKFNWIGNNDNISDSGKTRSIGIPNINNILVQEVIKMIIEPIYETTFSNNSFGFRPNRSCHHALKYYNTYMKECIWYIEGDIKDYLNIIDQFRIIQIIETRIKDPIILRLIRTGLKAKVFDDKIEYLPEVGTPQGGILSTLITNIYLDKFDKFMEDLCIKYFCAPLRRRGAKGSIKSNNRQKSSEYNALMRSGNKKMVYSQHLSRNNPFQEEYRSVKYIRYANKFIIGINGSCKLASEINILINKFFKEELNLNDVNLQIRHISKGIHFLGYILGRNTYFIKQSYSGKLVNRKMIIPTIYINMKKVISLLSELRFCDGSGKPIPNFRFINLSQYESNKRINMILYSLCNWWSIANDRKQKVAYVAYILRYSLAKVYAAKFKANTVAAIFKLGGNNLSHPIGAKRKSAVGILNKVKIPGILYDRYHKIPKRGSSKLFNKWKPDYIKAIENNNTEELIMYLNESYASNPLHSLKWQLQKSLRHQGVPCDRCGTFDKVQVYNIKDLKFKKSKIAKYIRAINISKIALCHKHYLSLKD
ncbi:hypothetical protein, partial (mitochondrion) [Candida oxycetoniae]